MPIIGITSSSYRAGGLPVSGAALWLDADDATTFTYSSGTTVSQWNDKSGNGRHFSQSNSSYQPVRNTNTQNGKAVVTFSTDELNATYDWSNSAHTLFLVCKQTTGGSFQNMFAADANSCFSYGIINSNLFGIFEIAVGFQNWSQGPTGSNADVLSFKSAGRSSGSVTASGWKNGTLMTVNPQTKSIASTTSAASIGAAGNTIGNEPFLGYFCEIILYPSELSDTNRQSVESYLKTKWGTP